MSKQDLINKLPKAAPDCFRIQNPILILKPDKKYPGVTDFQIESNNYKTNDHLHYDHIYSQIMINKSKKKIGIGESITKFASLNPSTTNLDKIKKLLKVPGHTTYGMQKKGQFLCISGKPGDLIQNIVNCLHLNSYLTE